MTCQGKPQLHHPEQRLSIVQILSLGCDGLCVNANAHTHR
jgi:hypothetical protein